MKKYITTILLICFYAFSITAQNLVSGEYFYDTDPGVGNATALPAFTASDTINSVLALPTTGLSTGFHNLFIRYKDIDGKWGIYEGRSFYVSPANSTPLFEADIINAEYFFDTDPGVGNGTALPAFTASDTINSNLSISVAGLTTGLHDLFIRYRDGDNKWGIYEGREFEVVVCNVPVANVTATSTTVCLGDTAFFTDNSTNIVATTTYAWDFTNDGIIDDTTRGNVSMYFATVGSYDVKLVLDHLSCTDSTIVTINVVAPTNTTETVNVCSGSSHTFPDNTTQNNITSTVTHTSNLLSGFGCDSVIVTTINVNPVFNHTNTDFVCSGNSYTFADGYTQNNITASISHTSNLQTINNCDSLVTTTINLYPDYNATTFASVCSGSSYTFLDGFTQNNITATVSHTNNFQTINSCDSIIVTTVSLFPDYNLTENVGVCTGSSFTFPDGFMQNNITAALSHTSNLQTVNSCDSIIVTSVSVTSNYQFSETANVCTGESYTFPDGTTQSNLTAQVVYVSTLLGGLGSCDTLMTTTVNVNPEYNLTETVNVCSGSSHTFPDGSVQNNLISTVTYTSNLQTAFTCDSIIVTTVTINSVFNQTETVGVCTGSSYTFPDGFMQNNITMAMNHTSNLQTVNNCDSIIVTTISITSDYQFSETANVCTGDSYTFPDGSTQTNLTAQVVYVSTLQGVGSCDTLMTTTVNVNPDFNLTESVNVCTNGSYTFPDNTVQNNLTANVTHISNLQTAFGCDSNITTTVIVSNIYNDAETVFVCSGESYTFPDGSTQNNITSTISHTSNLTSITACDTALITTVNVNPTYSETENVTVCSGDSYTYPDGTVENNIITNTTHTNSLTTINGCDSIVETFVSIESVASTISQNGNDLKASLTGVSYQWINCENNTSISGATNQIFSPTVNGDYAVITTNNGCSETSTCFTFVSVGVIDVLNNPEISIYPNPVEDELYIVSTEKTSIEILNILGKKVMSSSKTVIDVKSLDAGIYFVNIFNVNKELIAVKKVIKK